jgi:hypothetical protein
LTISSYVRAFGDQRGGDPVLHVTRADSEHALLAVLRAHLAHVLGREARDVAAAVQLGLLQQGQARVRRVREARHGRPQGCDLQRVRGDRLDAQVARAELTAVDPHLVLVGEVVRHVDLDRAVAERLHQLVVLEPLVLGLVRVPDDHLVDRRLRELLRLDRVLLTGSEQVVEERDVELENLDELEHTAVRDVELSVEVEGTRVGVGPVLRDLAVVDVARQFGRVLVLLVLRLEGAEADAVLLAEDEALDGHVRDDLLPVTVIALEQQAEVVATDRVELTLDVQLVGSVVAAVERLEDALARRARDEQERLLVHGRGDHFTVHVPGERVERALGTTRILLETPLQKARDRALGAADGTVKEDHTLLRAEPHGASAEDVDETRDRLVQTEDGVAPFVERIVEQEPAPGSTVLARLGAVQLDHVEQALPGVPTRERILLEHFEVLAERTFPAQGLVLVAGDAFAGDVEQGLFVERAHGLGRRFRAGFAGGAEWGVAVPRRGAALGARVAVRPDREGLASSTSSTWTCDRSASDGSPPATGRVDGDVRPLGNSFPGSDVGVGPLRDEERGHERGEGPLPSPRVPRTDFGPGPPATGAAPSSSRRTSARAPFAAGPNGAWCVSALVGASASVRALRRAQRRSDAIARVPRHAQHRVAPRDC